MRASASALSPTGRWGITDPGRKIPDNEVDVMTQILESFQLTKDHQVPEVQIRSGRVDAKLDAQRLSLFQFGAKFFSEMISAQPRVIFCHSSEETLIMIYRIKRLSTRQPNAGRGHGHGFREFHE